MATVTSSAVGRGDERYRINLGGTRAVFDHCHKYGVEHAIFVGRQRLRAGPDAPLYHTEEEPPQELANYPELADLVAADLFASTALWRYPEFTTTVLRNCYTLGPSGTGTLAMFLRGQVVPLLMGFDPLFQLMHEEDAALAIALTIGSGEEGSTTSRGRHRFRSRSRRRGGQAALPLPAPLLKLMLGRGGLPKLPAGALAHIKYPIVMDMSRLPQGDRFRLRVRRGCDAAGIRRVVSSRTLILARNLLLDDVSRYTSRRLWFFARSPPRLRPWPTIR